MLQPGVTIISAGAREQLTRETSEWENYRHLATYTIDTVCNGCRLPSEAVSFLTVGPSVEAVPHKAHLSKRANTQNAELFQVAKRNL